MDNEIRAPALARQFIAGSFHIPIGQPEALSGPPQPRAGLHIGRWKFPRIRQASNGHRKATFLLRFQNNESRTSVGILPYQWELPVFAYRLAESKKDGLDAALLQIGSRAMGPFAGKCRIGIRARAFINKDHSQKKLKWECEIAKTRGVLVNSRWLRPTPRVY